MKTKIMALLSMLIVLFVISFALIECSYIHYDKSNLGDFPMYNYYNV